MKIVSGARCTWWDTIDKAVDNRSGIPCCPFCGGVLFETENLETWLNSIKSYEANGHAGYTDLITWMRGKCYPSFLKAQEAYEGRNE